MPIPNHKLGCICARCEELRETSASERERTALGPSDATACSPRDLAARIATRLFTNGFGDQGERLEIKQATGYEKERSLGGWCYLAALDQITEILEENDKDLARRARDSE